jgi:tetratricopeptide (TPR) repeat protein
VGAAEQRDAADEVCDGQDGAALAADLGVRRTKEERSSGMNHSEWTARFKEAARLSADNREQASALLLELAAEAKRGSQDGIGEWHEQQALGTAGTFLEEAGNHERALELYQQTLGLCRSWATYWTRATTSMLAIIALRQFRQGQNDEAMATGDKALRYLGREPDADAILADLMKEMAKHRRKRGAGEQPDAADKRHEG